MATTGTILGRFEAQPCLICTTTVHASNKRQQYSMCGQWAHSICTGVLKHFYFCCRCLNGVLPFGRLSDDNFALAVAGVTNFTTKSRIQDSATQRLNLNPFYNLDDNFINNPEIDADANYYNAISTEYNNYFDSNQFNQYLSHNNKNNNLFSMMHLNINGLVSKADTLHATLQTLNLKFSIIAISETHTNQSTEQLADIPGYDKIIRSRTFSERGGVALFFDQNLGLNVKRRPDLDCDKQEIFESLFVQIPQTVGKDILVGVVYRRPQTNKTEFVTNFAQVFHTIKAENRPCYILGDYNINLLDQAESSNLTNELFSYGYMPLIDRPTRITPISSTLIDNIFTNVHDRRLTSGVWIADIADHLPIYALLPHTNIQHNINPDDKFVYKRIYSDENMNVFKTAMHTNDWSTVYNTDGVNNKYNAFCSVLNKCIDEFFPERKIKINTKSETKPWISHSLVNSIKKKNAMYKNYLKSRSPILLERYKKYKNKLVTIIRNAEKLYYSSKLQMVKDSMSKTWKLLNKMTGRSKPRETINQIEINGQVTDNQQEIADKFNDYFINVGPTLANQVPTTDTKPLEFLEHTCQNSIFLNPVTEEEVGDIISNLKNTDSIGYDNIPTKLLKFCSSELTQILTYINNESIQEGIFPDGLKIARVTPIYKSEDKKQVNNYRPISILTPLSKVSEKIMYSRLTDYITKHSILHPSQYGFRTGHSTSMALLKIVDDLTRAVDDRQITVGIFVDLAKAFDTVDHNILMKKLEFYGIRGVAYKWFCSYLTGRKQYVSLNKVISKQAIMKCGVPQGSILGPLLFLLYINDLNYVSNLFQNIMFADDTNLFMSGKNLTQLENNINNELMKVSCWFHANLLSLNVKKTSYIIFGNNNVKTLNLNIRIQNLPIERQYDTKFLGVILSSNLKWASHIQVVMNKISKNLGIIAKVRHLLPQTLTRMLYLTLVEPYINYCNIVWAGMAPTTNLDKIFRVQKKYCRLITFSKFQAHSRPLFEDLKLLNVYEIYKCQLYCYMYRLRNCHLPDIYNFVTSEDIHTYNTRHKNDIRKDKHRTKARASTVRFNGPTLWNKLSLIIKNAPTLNLFKKRIKTHILI